MSPERTVPSTRPSARNVVTAELPGCRSTTGSTSRGRRVAAGPTATVADPPSPSAAYPVPPYSDSPVHSDSGVTASASPVRAASSTWTVLVPTRWRISATCAAAATAGCASSASIDSSPWIVDSAPPLRFGVPLPEMPSTVRPVAGS